MQKTDLTKGSKVATYVNTGKPSEPVSGRLPVLERKTSDPSSCAPTRDRYPVPSFFEYRIKPKEHDPL